MGSARTSHSLSYSQYGRFRGKAQEISSLQRSKPREWTLLASCIIFPFMTGKQPKRRNQSAEATSALARWENEGGALQPSSQNDRERHAALAEEEHVLRCLGAAVIMQWNDLPTKIQRDLFDHAISMGEPRHTAQLEERVARFLQSTKDDESGRIRTPCSVEAVAGAMRPVSLRELIRA